MKKYNKYDVVARGFYRENEPILTKVVANNEDQAMDFVFKDRDIKEVLDVKLENEIDWNKETIKKYWLMYADEKTIEVFQ